MEKLFSQRAIVDALEEELRIGGKPLKFTVAEVQREGEGLFKVLVDPFAVTR